MRVFHHHHSSDSVALDPTGHHAVQHRGGRATPWFVIAAVAFLAALTVGCSSDSDATSADAGDAGSSAAADGAGDGADAAAPTTTLPENLFDTDFLGACDGVGQTLATAYTPTPGVISPVVVLGGDSASMYARSTSVRDVWTRTWLPEDTMAMREIQLVACAEAMEKVEVQECTGYEVDGVVTDAVVKLNEVTYAVTVHEALTGAQLAATTIVARDDSCPMFASFTEGLDFAFHDSFDDEAVMDFIAPFVTP